MDNKILRDGLISGFAVFAIFFGAGNLIFPGAVGLAAGSEWPTAMVAAILCGVVLPLLALVAVANAGNSWSELCKPVGVWYDKGAFFVSTVGMVLLSNLPRTAATTHEVAIAPLFPSCPIWLTCIIYFVIVAWMTLDQNTLIDKIGKYMTPVLLLLLLAIIGTDVVSPLGTPVDTKAKDVFSSSFIQFYYTGDLFSGLFISTIFIADLARKGYGKAGDRKKMTLISCLVAGIAFVIVYGGLLIMGAQSSGMYPANINRTTLLANMVHNLLGASGTVMLSFSVALACLTTASGLISIASEFLASLLHNKVTYKQWVIILSVTSVLMASTGVENIISVAAPIFMLIYPSGVCMTILGLFKNYLPNDGAFRYAVIGAVIAGVFDALNILGFKEAGAVTSFFPLGKLGFGWITFSVIGFFLGWMLYNKKEAKKEI